MSCIERALSAPSPCLDPIVTQVLLSRFPDYGWLTDVAGSDRRSETSFLSPGPPDSVADHRSP